MIQANIAPLTFTIKAMSSRIRTKTMRAISGANDFTRNNNNIRTGVIKISPL